MNSRKLESAALFLTVLGALLIAPPLALVFQLERRVFGLPAEVIYLFLVWAALIAGSWWLARRLPRDPPPAPDGRDDDT